MRINLTDIGTVYPFLLTNTSDEVRINCPECGDTKHHCYINLVKKVYYCFKCESSGRVSEEKVIDIKEWPNFKEKYKGKEWILDKPIEPVKNLPLSRSWDLTCSWDIGEEENRSDRALASWRYLINRGVTREQIEKYNIRYSREQSGPYKNTIIFPVYNKLGMSDKNNGQLKFFVCRKWDDSQPKYVNAPWPKEDTLFQTGDRKLGSNSEFNAIIVEGIFDALAIERAGYNSIALLGKRANSKQLERLMQTNKDGSPCKFIIYLDRDALSQAIHLKLQFSALNIKSVIIQHKQDAASLALSDMNELRTLIHAQGT